MAVAIDKAEIHRRAVEQKRSKAQNRVSSTVVRGKVADFLNSGDSYWDHMEDQWPGTQTAAYVVNRLNSVIREDKMDDLCLSYVSDDGATLVSYSPSIEAK